MIEWTIDACISSRIFSNVVVSTDCNEIADIARSAGAEVPFLRKEASDDISSASQATLATLHQYEEYYNYKPKTVCQLMANCPFRTAEDIRSGYFHFIDNKAMSQISVFKFGWMNPWWALKKDDNGNPTWLFPEALKERSQDLPDLYCPTGALWFAHTKELKKYKSFYMPKTATYCLEWQNALDIDNSEDLEMAYCVAKTNLDAINN